MTSLLKEVSIFYTFRDLVWETERVNVCERLRELISQTLWEDRSWSAQQEQTTGKKLFNTEDHELSGTSTM